MNIIKLTNGILADLMFVVKNIIMLKLTDSRCVGFQYKRQIKFTIHMDVWQCRRNNKSIFIP
jgi:hypothetical protein